MPRNNKDKDKDPIIDEVLDETPPDINEPIEEDPEDSEIAKDKIGDPENEEPEDEAVEDEEIEEDKTLPAPKDKKVTPPIETPEQKEQRYKAQQSEAQIQAEKNRALLDKVEAADKIEPPTLDEMKAWVKADGADWDELTTFEQSMAKKTYMSEKRTQLVSDAVKVQKQVDTWAKSIDDFIDSTDGKPEFIDLSGHEADFRKFSMKDAHRGAPVDILLSAFLHNLPPKEKKRGSMFEHGGGGDKQITKNGITDADQAAALRKSNPREYGRQVRAGKIKLDV